MQVITQIDSLRKYLNSVRIQQKTIGVVPTMGALHQGHLNLVRRSVQKCDVTVVTIFVNPLQFGPQEDLDAYPRRLEDDVALCAEQGAEVVFAPQIKDMYSPHHGTFVVPESVENLYCGAYRPGHFKGVLTIVAKLFLAVQPDWAFFGKKDYQQAALIQRMVEDLNFPIRIHLVPTARERSGLARSSRNQYLTQDERQRAVAIYSGLKKAQERWKQGERRVVELKKTVRQTIQKSGGSVQYIELASRKTLLPLKGSIQESAVILVAAFYGTTRLIDNLEL